MTTSSNGESVLDVLARMKGELAFDVDEMLQTSGVDPTQNQDGTRQAHVTKTHASPVQFKEPSSPASPPPASPPPAERSPEESVAELGDYMGNLLNRYSQGSAAMEPSAATLNAEPIRSSLPQRKPKPIAPKPAGAGDLSPNENESGEGTALLGKFCLLDQKEFIPRKRAPEEKACIDAMRELAVHSACKAIQVCDNKRRGLDAKHRLVLGFGAFAASGVAFFSADSLFSVFGALGMCGLAVGCMFIVNWQKTITLLKKSNSN